MEYIFTINPFLKKKKKKNVESIFSNCEINEKKK